MPSARAWIGLIVLLAASLAGHQLVRGMVSPVDQERLLRETGEAISRIPSTVGAWRTAEGEDISEKALAMLQCSAHVSRDYVNDDTGERVSLILLVGRSGPLVSHTPQVCYSSVDFEVAVPERPEAFRVGERTDTLSRIVFRANSASRDTQCVYYGWRRPKGVWEAPKSPRWTLGGAPMLCKLQLATVDIQGPDESSNSDESGDAARRFLAEFLPALDRVLESH